MSPFLKVLLIALLSMIFSECQSVEYRDNVPETFMAINREVHEDSALINAFQIRYKVKGKPRVALFWNREQTDALVREKEIVTTSTETISVTGSENTDNSYTGSNTLRVVSGLREGVVKQIETGNDDKRPSLSEKDDAILHSKFLEVLSSAGVRLVDRNMMLRTTAASNKSTDTQISETKALERNADWLMEVLLVNDSYAPLGYGFRVTVKGIKSSVLISEFYTKALPLLLSTQPFIAGPEGFQRAPAPITDANSIGQSLGLEVIRHLGISL